MIFGWRLGGQIQFQFLQQKLKLWFGLGIAGDHQLAAVAGPQMHVDYRHGGELFEHVARRQPRRQPCRRRARVTCRQLAKKAIKTWAWTTRWLAS